MTASVSLDPETGIWTFQLSGTVTAEEALRAYQEMRESPEFRPSAPRLWDARETVSGTAIDGFDLRSIAQRTGSGVAHKVAILVRRDVDFGISRMYQSHAELEDQPADTRIFRDHDEAVAWLVAEE
jgi:hypothetical protein